MTRRTRSAVTFSADVELVLLLLFCLKRKLDKNTPPIAAVFLVQL